MIRLSRDGPWKDARIKQQVIWSYVDSGMNHQVASIKLRTSPTYISALKKQCLANRDKDNVFVYDKI